MTSRLALGTVQFGMAYGVANRIGQISPTVAGQILDLARNVGIDTVDTAMTYGESETVLGALGVGDFKVVSKLPALPPDISNVTAWVEAQIDGTLSRLGRDRLHALLLHRPADLLGTEGVGLREALLGLKRAGRVDLIGFSIYAASELDDLVPVLSPDLVQSPFNVFDRRLQTTGWLARLAGDGVEIHARSLFLQGLLLLEAADVPSRFAPWNNELGNWHRWTDANNITKLQAALGFALNHPEITRFVVGIDSVEHMQQILAAATDSGISIPDTLSTNDETLINPANWASK